MAVFADDVESLKQYSRLRRDVGASIDVLDDQTAEVYFEEAQERYPDDESKMIVYARVLVLRGIRASAALLGKYAQNQSTEDLTKVFDNLTKLLDYWTGEVDKVFTPVEDEGGYPFFGKAQGQRGR
jgi:hypothetical protein